jgi:limonene-1,2-epoxide hydrolase
MANTITGTNAREIVMACIKALNEEDFQTAREYTTDNFSFVGVLGSRNGAAAYFDDMEKMKLKYDVKKVFVDRDDVCLLYDLSISGITIFGCGWYHVEDDKISSLRVVFDPRPVLELQDKNKREQGTRGKEQGTGTDE